LHQPFFIIPLLRFELFETFLKKIAANLPIQDRRKKKAGLGSGFDPSSIPGTIISISTTTMPLDVDVINIIIHLI